MYHFTLGQCSVHKVGGFYNDFWFLSGLWNNWSLFMHLQEQINILLVTYTVWRAVKYFFLSLRKQEFTSIQVGKET